MAYLDTNISPSAGTTTTFKRVKFDMPDVCCNGCLIGAPEVQLFYWPVDLDSVDPPIATPPASSYSLVSDNFTFISPSVYVAYRDLQATTACQRSGPVMGSIYNTTIAYEPGALTIPTNILQSIIRPALIRRHIPLFLFMLSSLHWIPFGHHVRYGAFDPPRLLQKQSAMVRPTPVAEPNAAAVAAAPPAHVITPYAPAMLAPDPNSATSHSNPAPPSDPSEAASVETHQPNFPSIPNMCLWTAAHSHHGQHQLLYPYVANLSPEPRAAAYALVAPR
ncbi:hypothetical protein ABVK25_006788 [Lepraria finkii]|uniref:Uncharacterized protein n=1 Tax=Lepraria finkii TaxID=1340010 RepID=A0ABR4B7L5_9LECA